MSQHRNNTDTLCEPLNFPIWGKYLRQKYILWIGKIFYLWKQWKLNWNNIRWDLTCCVGEFDTVKLLNIYKHIVLKVKRQTPLRLMLSKSLHFIELLQGQIWIMFTGMCGEKTPVRLSDCCNIVARHSWYSPPLIVSRESDRGCGVAIMARDTDT